MVWKQVRQYARHGYDAAIIFPLQGGPEALLAGIHSGYENGINIIVGGEMTHQGFLKSEGGCVTEEDAERSYKIAAAKGIRNFVMPGTKPERIKFYREMLAEEEATPITVFSPGLITQEGNISLGGRAAGEFYHGIVGRAIYERKPGEFRTPDEMRSVSIKISEKL
jgi:orotidine-5'-phosphate decarboxylase